MTTSGYIENESGDACNVATPADELTPSKNIVPFEDETENMTTSDLTTSDLTTSGFIENECIKSGDACNIATPADELTLSKNIASFEGETELTAPTNIASIDGETELIPLTEIVAIFQEEDKCDGGEEGQKPRTAREQGSLPEGVELVNLDASHPPPFKRHYAPSAYNRVYHPGFKLMAFHHLITMKRMAKFYSHI
eukprot:Em0013g1024a